MKKTSQSTDIIVLAAGKGKRIDAVELPKVLIPLGGKPIIAHLLEELKKMALERLPILVVGHQREKVKETLGEKYQYAVQEEQKGTAHAVAAALPLVQSERCLVLHGDVPFVTAESIKWLLEYHDANPAAISLFTSTVPHFEGEFRPFYDLGRIIRNKNGDIAQIKEVKDAGEKEKEIKEVNPAIYLFQTGWLANNIHKIKTANVRKEQYLTDTIEVALRNGHAVSSLPMELEEIVGINTPAQLQYAQELLAHIDKSEKEN